MLSSALTHRKKNGHFGLVIKIMADSGSCADHICTRGELSVFDLWRNNSFQKRNVTNVE